MAGRRPKSAALRALHGNAGHRPLPAAYPLATGRPILPAYLDARAAEIWAEYLPLLPWLARIDSRALALWCQLSVAVESGAARAALLAQWRALGNELGIGSGARSRMPPPSEWPAQDGDDPDDPAASADADTAAGTGGALAAYLASRPKRPTD